MKHSSGTKYSNCVLPPRRSFSLGLLTNIGCSRSLIEMLYACHEQIKKIDTIFLFQHQHSLFSSWFNTKIHLNFFLNHKLFFYLFVIISECHFPISTLKGISYASLKCDIIYAVCFLVVTTRRKCDTFCVKYRTHSPLSQSP